MSTMCFYCGDNKQAGCECNDASMHWFMWLRLGLEKEEPRGETKRRHQLNYEGPKAATQGFFVGCEAATHRLYVA